MAQDIEQRINGLMGTLDRNFQTWDRLIRMRAPLTIIKNHRHVIKSHVATLTELLANADGIELNEVGQAMYDTFVSRSRKLPNDLGVLYIYRDMEDNSPSAEENKKYFTEQIENLIVSEAMAIMNAV